MPPEALFFIVLGLLFLVTPFVAFFLALAARRQIRDLEGKVRILEARLNRQQFLQPGPRETREPDALPIPPISAPAPLPLAPAELMDVPRTAPVAPPTAPWPPAPSPERPPAPREPAVSIPPLPSAPPVRPKPVAAPALSLEERLGTRFFVWVGAVALALAGTYLVKYTFDQGLISPAVRVVLGSLFGLTLLAVGEFLRKRTARIAQAVSAAGVADLFACLLAATNLYKLISPTTGFALMAANTALAVALSLRQGPFVAALGMAGGFLTPVLIHTGEARVSLFAYLFMLEIGLVAVTRKRHWPLLTGITLLCGMGWAFAWTLAFMHADHRFWLGMFVLGSAAAFILASQFRREDWGESVSPILLTWLSAGLGLIVLATQLGVSHFSTMEWLFLGTLGAGCLVLARLREEMEPIAWVAALACAVMLVVWGVDSETDATRYGRTLLALAGLYTFGAYAAMWGAHRADQWAGMSALASLGFFFIAYFQVKHLPWGMSWGGVCLMLTGGWILGSAPIGRLRGRSASWQNALDASSTVAALFLVMAAWFDLKQEWIAVGWAGVLVAMAAACRYVGLLNMRLLSWLLGIAILARLFNPVVVHYPLSEHLLGNWLMYGYGLPMLAFLLASLLMRKLESAALMIALEGATLLVGVALVSLEIRQYFHPGRIGAIRFELNEWAVLAIAWLACGAALLQMSSIWLRPSVLHGGRLLAALGVLLAVLVPGLLQNPIMVHHSVGDHTVFNWLLMIYGGPALLAIVVAMQLLRLKDEPNARWIGSFGLLLVFLLVTLQVRQGFQGTYLDAEGTTGAAEKYAYSLAWLVLGAVLLLLGILTRGAVVRYASLLVILLAVGKVFLFDTAHLKDLYRVVSFLGLGVSLLVLAYIYQRFVFRRPGVPADPEATG